MDKDTGNAALAQYLEKVQERDKAETSVRKREAFLVEVLAQLQDQDFSAVTYRVAVADALSKFASDGGRLLYVATAREFFHHLRDAAGNSSIATPDDSEVTGVRLDVPESMSALQEAREQSGWDEDNVVLLERQLRDLQNVKRWLVAMKSRDMPAERIDEHRRQVLAMLFLIREQHADAASYRAGVSAVAQLLPADAEDGFIAAAREFYYFWVQDPATVEDPDPPAGDAGMMHVEST